MSKLTTQQYTAARRMIDEEIIGAYGQHKGKILDGWYDKLAAVLQTSINEPKKEERKMSNKDFAVQEELLKFAVLAAVHAFGSSDVRDAPTISKDAVREVVSSVLIFLSENPMVPTDEQIKKLAPWLPDFHSSKIERVRRTIVEWQRECFLAPDQEESAYMRVVKALGAVTLSREEGNRIVEYVGGAIHDGIRSPEPEIPISFSCPQCGVDITDRSIPYAHKSVAGNIMPGHTDTEVPKEIKDLLWHPRP